MSFIKRATYAVTKRVGHSFLLLFLFMIIANLVLAGYAIQNATGQAEILARQKLGAQVTLQFNMSKAMQEAITTAGSSSERRGFSVAAEPVTEEMAELIASHEHILDYNYIVNTTAMAEDFMTITTEEAEQSDRQPQGNFNFILPDISLVGVSHSALYESFTGGQYVIAEGTHLTITDTSSALIEKQLAALNDLQVGDTITIYALSEESADNATPLTIVGIFDAGASTVTEGMGFTMDFSQPYNRVFVDYKTALDVKENTTQTAGGRGLGRPSLPGIDTVMYFVDDPIHVETVLQDAEDLPINWDTFILDANSIAYEQMMGPIQNVASFSGNLVMIVALAGMIILALILMMWVKERMYETGVLLALGESKFKIALQYATEVLIVAVIAFSLSVFTGSFTSQAVGHTLLAREIQISKTTENNQPTVANMLRGRGGAGFPLSRTVEYEPISELEIQLSQTTLLKLYVMGLFIALGATVVPSTLVMRYHPRKILSQTL